VKKRHLLIIALCCITIAGATFCKRYSKNKTKGYRGSITSQTQGRQYQAKGKEVSAKANKKEERVRTIPETKKIGQEVQQEQSAQCMQDVSANLPEIEEAVTYWEGVLLAGKSARDSELVKNKLQDFQGVFKELCVAYAQETASNLNEVQKQLVGELMDDVFVVLKAFADYIYKTNEPGLDDSSKQTVQLEFQLKISQLMLTLSQKYSALQEASKRNPLLNIDPKETRETLSEWVGSLVDICKEIKISFCDVPSKGSDAEIVITSKNN